MRHFYRDPLAAAWMAKHFGMRFSGWDAEYVLSDFFCLDDGYEISERECSYYIHPDSLHLLEPKDGDLLEWDYGAGVVGYKGGCGEGQFGDRVRSIIQRNGIPFMWPETEND